MKTIARGDRSPHTTEMPSFAELQPDSPASTPSGPPESPVVPESAPTSMERPEPEEPAASPLGVARARRKLTVEQLAGRAGLTPEAVEALEEGRLYRFPSQRDAIAAVVLYSSALGISEREARELAGLAPRESLVGSRRPVRLAAVLAFTGAAALLAWFVIIPRFSSETTTTEPVEAALLPPPVLDASLPARWEIEVDVLNGSTAGRAAARLADRIAGLSYEIGDVTNAPRLDYPETRVYYTPGSAGIAERLGEDLGIGTQELPGGDEPRRLVVIAGAEAPLE